MRRLGASSLVLAVAAALLGPASVTGAAEVTVAFPAVERLLWRLVLTEGGRAYLEGGPDSPCRYAFVQEPKVSAAEGRLRLRFLFSGRAAASVAGRCVGPGDTFDIEVSGVPALAGEDLVLSDARVEAPDTAYFRLVRGLVEGQVRQRLRYPLKAELDRVAAGMGAALGVGIALEGFRLGQVRADADALRLSLELGLAVR